MRYLRSITETVSFICGLIISSGSFSQENLENNCKNCRQLKEVQVSSFSPEKFMAGLKIQKIDSINLARFQYQSLSDFLQFQLPITLKSYGSGQLTTISFRGTSANHTAILWNGLNINSPTVGLSDLSTIPVMGFDQMVIQYGSSASCVGSDAVGGSILLNSIPNWDKKGKSIVVGGQYGSFRSSNFNTGLYFTTTKKRGILSGKTLFYSGSIRNFYGKTPQNNEIRIDKRGREYAVEPSETLQRGIIQDLYFRINTKKKTSYRLFYLNAWLSDNKLIIEPSSPDFKEITQTKALRFIGGTQIDNSSIKLGFIRDILNYSFLNSSHASTDRYITRVEHDFSNPKNHAAASLRIGGEFVHYATKVDGYSQEIIHENRADVYALIRRIFELKNKVDKLTTSLNLRQAFSNRYKVPFTPAFGFNFNLFTNKNQSLDFLANIGRSYRLPTLNERYWKILGNLDIKPENGLNKEIGLEYRKFYANHLRTSLSAHIFHNLIDNWTYWNPDKNYRVENLQQVLSKGLELSSSLKFNNSIEQKNMEIILSYSLTDVSQQKIYDVYAKDIVGKQLIYVPRHAISGSVYYSQKKTSMSVQGMFNSIRYFTFDHSGEHFSPYFILNSTFTHRIKIISQKANLILHANNLTNTVYPNIKRNAMPGINFQLATVFNF